MKCRICRTELPPAELRLGEMPLANEFLDTAAAPAQETFALSVTRCPSCALWQLDQVIPPERLYRHYIYLSSTSVTVGRHARRLAAEMIPRYGLDRKSLVAEIASNDGTVLQAFHDQAIPVLGIEPARNIAALARAKGLETCNEFFTFELARQLRREGRQARLILARHVCAHVDDIVSFLQGVTELLEPEGVLVAEFPYLGDLVENLEFDTIYHEHLSYFSVSSFGAACERAGLAVHDVERIRLHGGSLLVHATPQKSGREPSERLARIRAEEEASGLNGAGILPRFVERLGAWRKEMGGLVTDLRSGGGRLAGYGAAAKANTLLNHAPEVASVLECIFDLSPWKQGKWTPGTRCRVLAPAAWKEVQPTHLLLLAWNFQEEIREQLAEFEGGGGKFIVPFPRPAVLPHRPRKRVGGADLSRVLVIGGTGLVGAALGRHLSRAGGRAVALSRRIRAESEDALSGDLTRGKSLLRAAEIVRPTWIVHAAGFPGGVNACERQPEAAGNFFLEGTRLALQAARQAGAGLVLLSTDAVFSSADEPVTEETPALPLSKYGQFKLAAEEIVRSAELPHLIIRTSNVYGWDPGSATPNFLMQVVRSTEKGDPFTASRILRATPTWAEDLAQAIVGLLAAGETGTFHVVGGEFLTREDWARKTVASLGLPENLVRGSDDPALVGPRPILRLSTQKLHAKIGWEPKKLCEVLQEISRQRGKVAPHDS